MLTLRGWERRWRAGVRPTGTAVRSENPVQVQRHVQRYLAHRGSGTIPRSALIDLQRAAGNAAVQRLVKLARPPAPLTDPRPLPR